MWLLKGLPKRGLLRNYYAFESRKVGRAYARDLPVTHTGSATHLFRDLWLFLPPLCLSPWSGGTCPHLPHQVPLRISLWITLDFPREKAIQKFRMVERVWGLLSCWSLWKCLHYGRSFLWDKHERHGGIMMWYVLALPRQRSVRGHIFFFVLTAGKNISFQN